MLHEILTDTLKKRKNIKGAEIGIYEGDTSQFLLTNPNIKLYLIDPYQKYEDYIKAECHFPDICTRTVESWNDLYEKTYNKLLYDKKTGKNRIDRAIFIRAKSEIAYKYFPDFYFDFVFIDGNHLYEYVKADIKNFFPKTKRNGWFGGHNYGDETTNEQYGVTKAVDEFIKKHKYKLNLRGNFWWVIKK